MKQRVKVIFAGGLLALTLFGGATAGQFEDGYAAYQRGDYASAMRLWRPLADQGDAAAQVHLGLMYNNGKGAPQDYAQAVMWWRKAADHGVALAQTVLGQMYGLGQGVPQDFVLAHMWFNLAASRAEDAATRDNAAKGRDLTAAMTTPAQIAEAQRMASEWKPK
jgi:uncharacterized protein